MKEAREPGPFSFQMRQLSGSAFDGEQRKRTQGLGPRAEGLECGGHLALQVEQARP